MGILSSRPSSVQLDPAVEFGLQPTDRNADPTDYGNDAPTEADRDWWETQASPDWWQQLDADRDWWERYESAVVERYARDRPCDFDQPHYRGS